MTKFVKYPSIDQFRQVVRQVNSMTAYQGKDEEGNALYDNTIPMPTLTFKGTVKLHGTNAGVCYDPSTGEIWAQKRTGLCTVEKDNAGWAFFVESNKDAFGFLFSDIQYRIVGENSLDVITLFGEWCGGNIQKGVAISELGKMFVMFGMKVGENWYDLPSFIDDQDSSIWNIRMFDTYSIDIDFSNPAMSQNKLLEITLAVEEECPVGKTLGVSGTGEGVVWECSYKGQVLRFKVKGEKHSATKVKKLAAVDTEKLNSINEFVEYAVTNNRLNQGIEQVFTLQGEEIDIKKMGVFLKWVMGDICKEEMDTLVDNNLEPKDIARSVSNKARAWFMEVYNGSY
jgi:hypothetical protein